MPQSPQQNRDTFSQNAVSGAEMRQAPLLSSSDSGMIVLSSSARILHMNGPARALMSLFGTSHEHWPQMAPESMPSIITEFCLDVLAQLRRRIEAQDWTQFEMRRICHMVTPSLLLTGFGVPSASNSEIRVNPTLFPGLHSVRSRKCTAFPCGDRRPDPFERRNSPKDRPQPALFMTVCREIAEPRRETCARSREDPTRTRAVRGGSEGRAAGRRPVAAADRRLQQKRS